MSTNRPQSNSNAGTSTRKGKEEANNQGNNVVQVSNSGKPSSSANPSPTVSAYNGTNAKMFASTGKSKGNSSSSASVATPITVPKGRLSVCVAYASQDACTLSEECAFTDGKCISNSGDAIDKQLEDVLNVFGIDKKDKTLYDNGVLTETGVATVNRTIEELESLLARASSFADNKIADYPNNVIMPNADINTRERIVKGLENHIGKKMHNMTTNYNDLTESTYKVLMGRIEIMRALINRIKNIKNSTQEIDKSNRKSLMMKLAIMLQGTQTIMNGLTKSMSSTIHTPVIGGGKRRKSKSKSSSRRSVKGGGNNESPFI
jgi:hypothetical protein